MTIQKICVCGAGTMGSGIAQVAAQAGHQVILYDVNTEMLIKAKMAIGKGLEIAVAKNKITPHQKKEMIDRIFFTNHHHHCLADIVIEAIVENIEIKASLFNLLAEINHAETIFASNTSSLSITQIQQQTQGAQRVVGLHFFNPAPAMKLVEIVKGQYTSNATMQAMQAFTIGLGKTPVECIDAPGFIVNRVARPYYLEAMRLVSLGIASIETVDETMEGCGFKMGPFKLMDLIGIDINYAVSTIVFDALAKPQRLEPSAMQKEKVDSNKLGKKTSQGFYKYL